jgi:hypothetical protein
VVQFKYLGTAVTDINFIQVEVKKSLNSGNACYHSVQNLLSSHLLSRNIKIRIHKTMTLSMVLYGCETWSLTLRQEKRLREQGAEENIWTEERRSDKKLEKTA